MEENTNKSLLDLQQQIEAISDQLCMAVKGEFDFTINMNSVNESIQKLTMLVNFVLDSARRSLLEVRDQNVKLTELDQLKSEFMANISHELRTPLTLILGPLEAILRDGHFPQEQRMNLQRMQRNTARLYMLVNDLLDLSKLEAGKFTMQEELLDLNELIAQLVDDAQGLAHERKLNLQYTPNHELGLMLFDRKMLEKIVLNLISNALKFTPENGHIAVQLTKQKGTIQIIVSDDGIGIPADKIKILFERFRQIDTSLTRAHEGTGIGLALIQQFAELMQGKIDVKSEAGKGTQFIVTLPIKVANSNQITEPPSIHQPTLKVKLSQFEIGENKQKIKTETTKNKNGLPRILVADDNPDMRSYIVSLLEDSFEVAAVENGKAALEIIQKFMPQIILSDVMMPVMDGYQLTKTLKADPTTQHIPIILITAKAGKEAIVSGLEVGADDYLSKPFSAEELKARTHSALRLYKSYLDLVRINDQLKNEIEERNKVEEKNIKLNKELVAAARSTGMAEIATSVLHNIGNVLNSVNTSITLISEKIRHSTMEDLLPLTKLLQEHQNDLGTFLLNHPQGQLVPQYLIALSDSWVKEKDPLLEELIQLDKGVQHIKEIIIKQNSISRALSMTEEVEICALMEDALVLNRYAYEQGQIEIIRDFSPIQKIVVDRVKLLQILVNLIKNSIESLTATQNKHRKINVQIRDEPNSHFLIQISDNGVGVAPENLDKVFSHGFTTKKHGHGFGLHNSALSAKEMGGKLSLSSDGVGKGATFTLDLPYTPSNQI